MDRLPTGTVTFLFADIEGSTRLLRLVGPAYADLLNSYRAILEEAIVQAGGVPVDATGDGFFAAFPRATKAVAAALTAQRAIYTHHWAKGAKVSVRMALHTGEPIVAGQAYVGFDVHRVARLCGVAHGGQILVSETTHNLICLDLPDAVTLRNLGKHRLRDLQRSEPLFQVVHPDLPSGFPSLRSVDAMPNNLPMQLTSFIGREREISEVSLRLSSSRLLTLTGPGGCGKTRLGLQIAADLVEAYPDGCWLVELSAISDAALVLQTTAGILGVREERGSPLLSTLSTTLASKRMLLILDNCEHLVGACAQMVETLLRACAHLRVLITSREPLNIPGEAIYRVPPLSLPRKGVPITQVAQSESVRLFVERASDASRTFALNHENASAIVQACHQLDGIPLAIELAAARVNLLSVPQLAARLVDGLRLLRKDSHTVPTRHQTLQATMEWSFNLLSHPERALFRRFAVFPGTFSLEAAETVCSSDTVSSRDVFDLLGALVDKSLVQVEEVGETRRYRLLDTVRKYAQGKLSRRSQFYEVQRRHCAYYLQLALRTEQHLTRPDDALLSELETEQGNFRAALGWALTSGDAEVAIRIAAALWHFWHLRGYWTEGRRWLEAALTAANHAPSGAHSEVLYGAAVLAQHQGDYDRAISLSQELLEAARKLEDENGIARALSVRAFVAYERGEFKIARELHEEALVYAREARDRQIMASSLVNLAVVADHEGQYIQARQFCEESLALFRGLEDRRGMTFALSLLGIIASDEGDYGRAQSFLEEGLSRARELGDKRGVATSLTHLGLVARERGDHGSARRLYEESLALKRELGDKYGIAAALNNLALIAYKEGNSNEAHDLLRECLQLRHTQGNRAGIARGLETLAWVTVDPERAAQFLGAAAQLRDAVGATLFASERADHDQAVEALVGTLGDKKFKLACEEGRRMALEEIVEMALAPDRVPVRSLS